jgi:MFS family permease
MPALTEDRLTRRPGLVAFLGSRSLSSFATQMQAVALGWQLYAMTGRPLSLGLLGLAQFLPVAGLVFVSGQVVDLFDRRRVARLCQLLEAACAAALAAGAYRHALTPGMIYALVALFGAARAFEGPALQALLPALVTPAQFPRAAAMSSSLSQTATIVGPSIGGLLYGADPMIAFALPAAAFAAASCLMTVVRSQTTQTARGRVTIASILGGLSFIIGRRDILGAISLDLFAVLLGGATALLPVYARDILHAGPFGLGLLRAAPAIGALAVASVLARRPLRRHEGRWMFTAVALFGVATIVFGLSRSVPLSILALAILGGADVVSVVIRSTLIQLRTPDEMRGRVASVNLLFIGSSNQLGEFESGTLASLIGTVPAVVFGGLGTLAVVGWALWAFPSLRRLDRISKPPRE